MNQDVVPRTASTSSKETRVLSKETREELYLSPKASSNETREELNILPRTSNKCDKSIHKVNITKFCFKFIRSFLFSPK